MELGGIIMPKAPLPMPFSVDFLNEILIYDSDTGVFYNKVDRCNGKHKKWAIAGGAHRSKTNEIWYWRIYVLCKPYQAHRLAYYMFHGKDPYPLYIDHINRNGLDNSITNLREVTVQQNNENRSVFKNNTSGFAGVYKLKGGKWSVRINDKKIGTYENQSQAVTARYKAEIEFYGGCRSSG